MIAGVRYTATVDPSGGGPDAFTFAIVHLDGNRFVQDVMRGWAKGESKSVTFEAIVAEIADVCRAYGILRVVGDRYAGDWVSQAFTQRGFPYQPSF